MSDMSPSAEERANQLSHELCVADSGSALERDILVHWINDIYADGLARKDAEIKEAVEREQAKTRVFLVERAALYTPGEEGRHYYGLIIGQLDRRARGEG